MNTVTVKVGKMPGRIEEFVVAEGTSIAELLNTANLSADGYEVKMDSAKVEDLDNTKVSSSTRTVILAQRVKGNA